MDRRVNISRHGIEATLLPLAPAYWRISVDGGRGGQFEHQGSRESAEHRAGWECWCYKRMPVFRFGGSAQRSSDLISSYFGRDDSCARRRHASAIG